MTTEAAQKPPAPGPGSASEAPTGGAASSAPQAVASALSRALADNVISAWLGRHEFALHRLHSLAGILFGGYVIFHLVVNATLAQGLSTEGGKSVYQLQVDRIHSLPFVGLFALVFILLPILFHSIYGIVLLSSARPNVDRYGYPKNWAWLLQRITAIILVVFLAFHYLSMKGAFGGNFGRMLTFVPVDHATQSVVNHVHAAWWIGWFLYPLGLLAAAYHTAYGFWTAGITWGLTISSRAQRVWLRVCMALFVLLLACGFAALGAALGGAPTAKPLAGAGAEQGETQRDGQPDTRPDGGGGAEPSDAEPGGESQPGAEDAAAEPSDSTLR